MGDDTSTVCISCVPTAVWNIMTSGICLPWVARPTTILQNQCYVAGVNRVGRDPWCEYCGHTALVDAYGRVVTSCAGDDALVVGEVDMDGLEAFRRKFPVLDDRDSWPEGAYWGE